MILRELFYFDPQTVEPVEDKRYDANDDESVVDKNDTRKTRLSLKQIQKIRKSSELHNEEKLKELDFVKQMYGIAAQQQADL